MQGIFVLILLGTLGLLLLFVLDETVHESFTSYPLGSSSRNLYDCQEQTGCAVVEDDEEEGTVSPANFAEAKQQLVDTLGLFQQETICPLKVLNETRRDLCYMKGPRPYEVRTALSGPRSLCANYIYTASGTN